MTLSRATPAAVAPEDPAQIAQTAIAGSPRGYLSPTASVIRGAMALLSTQPLTWGASLIAVVLVPHYLGDTAFGQFASVWAISGLAGAVVTLGIPAYLVRRAATEPARAVREGPAALAFLVCVSFLAAGALSFGLPRLGFSPTAEVLLRIALIGMVIASAQAVVNGLLVGQERHGWFAWTNAGGVVTATAVGVGVLAAGGGVLNYALVSGIVVPAAVVALSWHFSGFRIGTDALKPRLWGSLIRSGLPFLGWNVALKVRAEIDVPLVAMLTDAQTAGWLAAAYRIISIPIFLPTLITTPLYPALSRSLHDRPAFARTLRRSVIAVLVITIPLSAFIIALAPAIPDVLHWPAGFRNSVPLMMILAFQQPLVAMDTVLGTALFALNRERRWLRVAILGAVFNPAANLVLIPLLGRSTGHGVMAAAVVEVATEMLMLVGALVLLPRGMLGRDMAGTIARLTAAGIALALVAAALRSVWLPLAVLGGGVTFVGIATALGTFRSADIRAAWKLALPGRERFVSR